MCWPSLPRILTLPPPPGAPGAFHGRAADCLLSGYVELHGRQLTLLVRRSVSSTNWLQVGVCVCVGRAGVRVGKGGVFGMSCSCGD